MDYTSAPGYVTDAQGRRQYQDRDLLNGVKGTSLVAKDRNAILNGLMYLIQAVQIVPNPDDDSQVWAAVEAMIKSALVVINSDLDNKVSNNNAGSADLVISDIAGNSDKQGVHVWGQGFPAITLPSAVTVTAQVNAVQDNLTAAVAAQADTNAEVQTDLGNKVSNNNAGSANLVISDIAGNSDGNGVHVWGAQFAAITLPSAVTVTAQVNAVQDNLTAAVAAQADTNATQASTNAAQADTNAAVQTALGNKVSNNNAGSADLVISDIAGNSDGNGVHVWGSEFAAITLPSAVTVTAQVNAVQDNLTAAVAAQADTNAEVQTDLGNKVSNNHAASGQDVISDIAGNSDGSLAAWGPDFTEQKYLPSALMIDGATSVTQIGALTLQTFEVTLDPNGSNGAVTATVTLPKALKTGVLFAKGNALNGTQSDGSLRPSVNVLPASLTQVTVIADNLRGLGWGESVTIQVFVMGS